MEELYDKGYRNYKPILFTYNGVLHAMMRNAHTINRKPKKKVTSVEPITTTNSMPSEMELIVQQMEHVAATGHNPDALPNNITYNMLITAWSRSRDPNAGEKAENVLNHMHELYEGSPVERANVKPDVFSYSSVLDAWLKSNKWGSAKRAEAVLRKMEERYQSGDVSVKPNMVAVSTVICAWCAASSRGENGAAQRAHSLLEWSIRSYLDGNTDVQPQLIIFNRVLDALAKSSGSKSTEGVQRAEELLGRLEQLYQMGIGIEPDVYSYTIIITAWSRSAAKDAAHRAEAILNRMEKLYLEGANKARPNDFTYNAVISAFSRKKGIEAAEKAVQLLNRMEQLVSEGNEDVRPDKITFSCVMTAWMNSGTRGSAYRVEELHKRMEELYFAGNEKCKPDSVSFSTVIGALAKSGEGDAPQRAEAVFRRMREFGGDTRPNQYTYNSLILAWIESSQPDAMQRAELIVENMVKQYEMGDIDARPDNVTFTTILDGLSKRYDQEGAADRAEMILERMIDLYRSGMPAVKPSSWAFNTVMMVYARSGKVEETVRILRRLEDLNSSRVLDGVQPTLMSYNSILHGCAVVETNDEARRRNVLSVALSMMNEIEKSPTLKADSFTYGDLFKVCGNLITDEEEQANSIVDLLDRCCRDGQVNGFVIGRIRTAVKSDELFWKLFGPYRGEGDYVEVTKLPLGWVRNAR